MPRWLADAGLTGFAPPAANPRIYHTRIESGTAVTPDSLLAMRDALPGATRLLPANAGIRVVGYGCTSGTTLIGEAGVQAGIRAVLPAVAVTNPLTATRRWLDAHDCRRLALLTPYIPAVTDAMRAHFLEQGIDVTHCASYFEETEARVSRISERSVLDSLLALGAHADCDAVFASCTNLSTLAILGEARHRLGKPVISSNAALAWDIARLLHIGADAPAASAIPPTPPSAS